MGQLSGAGPQLSNLPTVSAEDFRRRKLEGIDTVVVALQTGNAVAVSAI